VNVMLERIENMQSNSPNGRTNLLKDHVFQFDFLNDDFSKLPKPLQEIINNPEKRRKLVVYINPPYAEHGSNATGNVKVGVNLSKTHDKYHTQLAGANRELFAQFLIRIYNEIPNCIIGEFSTLKTLLSSHFKEFRSYFRAKLSKMFIVPADTFDNVKGQFPIGFKIWDTFQKEIFKEKISEVFDKNGNELDKKGFYSYEGYSYYSVWVNYIKLKLGFQIGWLQGVTRNDFQTQNGIDIRNKKEQFQYPRGIFIYIENLIECTICYAVRKCIMATWLNDRDQFLFPNESWKNDKVFQNDCLTYTLFSNNIQSKYGVNHWIPFSEREIQSREKFESNIMSKFINGKLKIEKKADLLKETTIITTEKLEFSPEAKNVFDAGRELWRYYHSQPECNVNASLYDIREYFQGRNDKGKMKNKSNNEIYTKLITDLRESLKILAQKIEPKVYEYEFLKQ